MHPQAVAVVVEPGPQPGPLADQRLVGHLDGRLPGDRVAVEATAGGPRRTRSITAAVAASAPSSERATRRRVSSVPSPRRDQAGEQAAGGGLLGVAGRPRRAPRPGGPARPARPPSCRRRPRASAGPDTWRSNSSVSAYCSRGRAPGWSATSATICEHQAGLEARARPGRPGRRWPAPARRRPAGATVTAASSMQAGQLGVAQRPVPEVGPQRQHDPQPRTGVGHRRGQAGDEPAPHWPRRSHSVNSSSNWSTTSTSSPSSSGQRLLDRPGDAPARRLARPCRPAAPVRRPPGAAPPPAPRTGSAPGTIEVTNQRVEPGTAPGPQRGQQPGPHHRRLARSRRADHGQQPTGGAGPAEPLDEAVDEALAAEEVGGVGLVEGPQALVGVARRSPTTVATPAPDAGRRPGPPEPAERRRRNSATNVVTVGVPLGRVLGRGPGEHVVDRGGRSGRRARGRRAAGRAAGGAAARPACAPRGRAARRSAPRRATMPRPCTSAGGPTASRRSCSGEA